MSGRLNACKRIVSSQRGYTLIELMVAMGIFAIVLVTAVGSYVSVSQSSTKSSSQRKVQQDARFNVEEMARQTRSAGIDYGFYALAAQQNSACQVNSTNRPTLALLYTEADSNNLPVTKRVVYYFDSTSKAVYRYENINTITNPDCTALNTATDQRVTANNVNVVDAKFLVSPDQDPNSTTSNLAARYTHPRATISLSVQTNSAGSTNANQCQLVGTSVEQINRYSCVTLQTTVSTRSYPVSQVTGAAATIQQPVAPAPPTAWPPTGFLGGASYFSCTPVNPYSCLVSTIDGFQAVGAWSGGTSGNPPWVVGYRPGVLEAGTYRLSLTYANLANAGLPVPPNYKYHLNVAVTSGGSLASVNGGTALGNCTPNATSVCLPTTAGSPTGTATSAETMVATFTVTGGQDLAFQLSWDNDQFAAGSNDANLAIVSLRLVKQ